MALPPGVSGYLLSSVPGHSIAEQRLVIDAVEREAIVTLRGLRCVPPSRTVFVRRRLTTLRAPAARFLGFWHDSAMEPAARMQCAGCLFRDARLAKLCH